MSICHIIPKPIKKVMSSALLLMKMKKWSRYWHPPVSEQCEVVSTLRIDDAHNFDGQIGRICSSHHPNKESRMSSVDNNQSLNAIMQKIGINPAEEKACKWRPARSGRFSEADDNPPANRIHLRLWKMPNLLPRWLSSRQLQVSPIWGDT